MPVWVIIYILGCNKNGHFPIWTQLLLRQTISLPWYLLLNVKVYKIAAAAAGSGGKLNRVHWMHNIKIYLCLWSIDKNKFIRRQIMQSFLYVWTLNIY